jgi:hypothetical protein
VSLREWKHISNPADLLETWAAVGLPGHKVPVHRLGARYSTVRDVLSVCKFWPSGL